MWEEENDLSENLSLIPRISSPICSESLSDEVQCVCLGCDDRLAASAGRSVCLWRWTPPDGWALVRRVSDAHSLGVTCLCWSSTGALLASGGLDGALRLWKGDDLSAVSGYMAAPMAMAVRALAWKGARLFSAHDDGCVRVWSALRVPPQLDAVCRAHDASVRVLTFALNGAMMITLCTEGVLKMFQIKDVLQTAKKESEAVCRIEGTHSLGALCGQTSECGRFLATGGHEAVFHIWRVNDSSVHAMCSMRGHSGAVTGLRWCSRTMLASCSLDRTARIWSLSLVGSHDVSGVCLLVIEAHERYLTCLTVHSRLKIIVTGSNDKTVRTWSLDGSSLNDVLRIPCEISEHFGLGDLRGIEPLPPPDINNIENTPPMLLLEPKKTSQFRAHPTAITVMACHQNHVVTSSSDGFLRLWRRTEHSFEEVRQLQGRGSALCVAMVWTKFDEHLIEFDETYTVLVTIQENGQLAEWDKEGNELRRSVLVDKIEDVCMKGSSCVTCGNGDVSLWERSSAGNWSRKNILTLEKEMTRKVLWNIDQSIVIVAGCDIRLFTKSNDDEEFILNFVEKEPHEDSVQCIELLEREEDTLLVSSGYDGCIRQWRVAGGALAELRRQEAHAGGAALLRWGGRLLLSGGADQWLRVWSQDLILLSSPQTQPRGVTSICMVTEDTLLVGGVGGMLEEWILPKSLLEWSSEHEQDSYDPDPNHWTPSDLEGWIHKYVINSSDARVCPSHVSQILDSVGPSMIIDEDLLSESIDALLTKFGYEVSSAAAAVCDECDSGVRKRLRDELVWVQRLRWRWSPRPPQTPHWLLCPLSHRVFREPIAAADGFTYDRCSLRESQVTIGYRSPLSGDGAPTDIKTLKPNEALRSALRVAFSVHDNNQHNDLNAETDDCERKVKIYFQSLQ